MRTRTSRSPRCTRCSRASTTGSSDSCPRRSRTSRSSKSPAASSARRSSTSPTTSSSRPWACGWRPYRGYDPHVNASLTTEFATAGYRMHSMVHGEFDIDVPAGTYSPSLLATFVNEGIDVQTAADGSVQLTVPLTLAFGNPDLLQQIGEGPLLAGLASERQYKNDEQIDNSMRSVLFQIPKPGSTQPCATPVIDPNCFTDVTDLGRHRHPAGPRPRHPAVQRPPPRVRPPAGAVVHGHHRRVDRSAPAGADDQQPGHPRLHASCSTTRATSSRSAATPRRRTRWSEFAARRSRRG